MPKDEGITNLNRRPPTLSFGHSDLIRHSSFACHVERSRDPCELNLPAALGPLNKCSRSAAYFLRHARFGRHKFRGEPRKQSDQIVRDQNLSVAMLARADADRRDADCISDLS